MNNEVGRNHFGELTIQNNVLKSFDIVPNSFIDMQRMNESNKVKVRLFNIQSNTLRKDERIELEMTNSVKNDVFLVVFGGWIPCAFIKKNTILLADRNVISEIVSRYKNGKKKNDKPMDEFDCIFLGNKVSLDITAFVLEGNQRTVPDNSMIDEQIVNATKSLKSALPNLEITKYPNGNGYYYAFRDSLADTIKKSMDFLQNIAPKLNKQFTEKSKEIAVRQVFSSAEEFHLKKSNLAVLLALLRITMIGKKTAAQLILKDSQLYSEDKSYNAVCDLTAIELLINMHNFHDKNNTKYNIAFITKDKGLSLFSSLFTNTEVSGSNEDHLNINARITGAVFGNDPTLVKMYEDWFAGKI